MWYVNVLREESQKTKKVVRNAQPTNTDYETKAIDTAEIVIDANGRLEELLDAIPKAGNTLTSTGGRKATLPKNVTHKQSHQAQTVSKNPEIVQAVKKLFKMSNHTTTLDISLEYDMYKLSQNRKPWRTSAMVHFNLPLKLKRLSVSGIRKDPDGCLRPLRAPGAFLFGGSHETHRKYH